MAKLRPFALSVIFNQSTDRPTKSKTKDFRSRKTTLLAGPQELGEGPNKEACLKPTSQATTPSQPEGGAETGEGWAGTVGEGREDEGVGEKEGGTGATKGAAKGTEGKEEGREGCGRRQKASWERTEEEEGGNESGKEGPSEEEGREPEDHCCRRKPDSQ